MGRVVEIFELHVDLFDSDISKSGRRQMHLYKRVNKQIAVFVKICFAYFGSLYIIGSLENVCLTPTLIGINNII